MPKETPNIVLLSEWKQDTRLNLIFVHGLSGNLFETWKSNNTDAPEKGVMWPQWLVEDNPGTAAYAYGYNAPMAFWQRGGRMTLGQRAENLRSNIDGRELLDKPCVLICHSLGGLVVKRMLLDLQKTATTGNAEQQKRRTAQLANVRGVVFIATPHYGSKLAITLDRFLFISSTSVESLKYGNSELISIQSDYVNFAATYKNISHIQYTESGLTSGLRVVDPLSGRAPIAFIETNQTDHDHVRIVKPKDKQDQVYAGIDTYISRLILAIPADENDQLGELQHTEIPPTPKPGRAGIYLGIAALGLVAAGSIFAFVPTWLRPVLPCNIAVWREIEAPAPEFKSMNGKRLRALQRVAIFDRPNCQPAEIGELETGRVVGEGSLSVGMFDNGNKWYRFIGTNDGEKYLPDIGLEEELIPPPFVQIPHQSGQFLRFAEDGALWANPDLEGTPLRQAPHGYVIEIDKLELRKLKDGSGIYRITSQQINGEIAYAKSSQALVEIYRPISDQQLRFVVNTSSYSQPERPWQVIDRFEAGEPLAIETFDEMLTNGSVTHYRYVTKNETVAFLPSHTAQLEPKSDLLFEPVEQGGELDISEDIYSLKMPFQDADRAEKLYKSQKLNAEDGLETGKSRGDTVWYRYRRGAKEYYLPSKAGIFSAGPGAITND